MFLFSLSCITCKEPNLSIGRTFYNPVDPDTDPEPPDSPIPTLEIVTELELEKLKPVSFYSSGENEIERMHVDIFKPISCYLYMFTLNFHALP